MIRFANVSKAYLGGKPALQGLSFHLPVGSMTYLVGHSGAGKSTLLKLIMGMERANGGQIWFNGHDITRLSRHEVPFYAVKSAWCIKIIAYCPIVPCWITWRCH